MIDLPGLSGGNRYVRAALALLLVGLWPIASGFAQKTPPKKTTVAVKSEPTEPRAEKTVGFPKDAGPHDGAAHIEWWYFNTFVKTETGRNLAIVGSFFRTGLSATKKGHYLIFSKIDLETGEHDSYSILDRNEIGQLTSVVALAASARPDDPRPMRLLRQLQRGELPAPHQLLNGNAVVSKSDLFSIAFENNTLSQVSADGRKWNVQLNGEDWMLDLHLSQPDRPAMLPGGKGHTGIRRPEDFYYLSLTRMEASGTLTGGDGVVEKFAGSGWLDRQWGLGDFVTTYGWDWFGLQLDNGDDLIIDRIREVGTGKIIRYRATLLTAEGKQIVETEPEIKRTGEAWRDPVSRIAFPARWEISLPTVGYKLRVTPSFPKQTIPVIGIGDAIWEGAVKVEGADKDGNLLTGRGFMELVGYHR
ncbi:MAG: lipocalin family protein [Capsulimonadales bacterium]|nr:lipocalin family protein [Capsulimonadales bacterium]